MPTPLPVIDNVFYGSVTGLSEGLVFGNTFCFRDTGAVLAPTVQFTTAGEIAVAIAGRWPLFAHNQLCQSYTGSEVRIYPLGAPAFPAAVVPLVAAGNTALPPTSPQIAALISTKVARRGRGSQSRTYIGPIGQDKLTADGKSIGGAIVASMQASWDTFINGVISDVGVSGPLIVHGQLSKKGAGAFYAATSDVVGSLIATLRSRAPRK